MFLCRPYGTRLHFSFLPGTSVPGFHMLPLRGFVLPTSFHIFTRNSVLTHTLEAAPFLNRTAIEFLGKCHDYLRWELSSSAIRTFLQNGGFRRGQLSSPKERHPWKGSLVWLQW